MLDICLTAPGSLPLGVSCPQQGLPRVPKEFQPLLQCNSIKQENLRSRSALLKLSDIEYSGRSMHLHSELEKSFGLAEVVGKSVIVHSQDGNPGSLLLNIGITKQSIRHENSLQFVMPSDEADESCLHSLFSKPTDVHQFAVSMYQPQVTFPENVASYKFEVSEIQSSLIYSMGMPYSQKPCMISLRETDGGTLVSVHQDGQILFTETTDQMKDMLSLISEFYHPKNASYHKSQLLVPHFARVNEIEAFSTAFIYSTNQKTMAATPVASPMEVRPKSLPKKRSARKTIKERDIFSKSYFHACENLLTMLVDKHSDKKLALSLKRSSPRLAQMLTNFSIAIAGTGLAVMLFMFTKAINGRFFLSANKLLNVGCGFGLVWVSWAVNGLRDTIESVGKPCGKVRVRDEKIGRRLKKNVNQIVFRAATVMAVVALRLA
ncbi:uncharacterized protein LOC116261115 [Nymphaea colorata]|nr:uncharacterized protein LOC116261115 [Nymphaea colorata]